VEEGDLLGKETREEAGARVRVGPLKTRRCYDTHHHLIYRHKLIVSLFLNVPVIGLTSSSNPYLVSGASFPQAVKLGELRLSLRRLARERTAVEFYAFTLVLLDCLFDSNQFSVRVLFLELP